MGNICKIYPFTLQVLVLMCKASKISVIFCVVYVMPQYIYATCPQRSSTRACSCQDVTRGLDVSCEGTTLELLRESVEAVSQTGQVIVFLKLHQIPIYTFPAFLLNGLEVSHLIVKHCNLTNIDDSAFVGFSDKLESLDLSENIFTEVPSMSLKALSSLVSLSLDYNRIEVLQKAAFSGLVSLVRLHLYGNRIKVIDSNVFFNSGGNLSYINLGNNQLSSVASKGFLKLTNLKTIDLNDNKIGQIEETSFTGLSSVKGLENLNLAGNSLRQIPKNSFRILSSIISLKLCANNISTIYPSAFAGIEDSLERLYLGENELTEIPSSALDNLTSLQELDLRGNYITAIKKTSLKKFGTSLRFLILKHNRLSTIEVGAFDDLHSLEWLYLDSNRLTTVSFQTFHPVLDTLRLLDLHDNPFQCNCNLHWFHNWMSADGKGKLNMPESTQCSILADSKKIAIRALKNQMQDCTNRTAKVHHKWVFMFCHFIINLTVVVFLPKF